MGMDRYRLPDVERAVAILRADEGVEQYAYDDGTGKRVHAPTGRLTIGIGINLDAGLADEEIDWLCRRRLHRVLDVLPRELETLVLPGGAILWNRQPEGVRLGLALMGYQLGVEGVMEFHRMLEAVAKRDYAAAAAEALDSKWAQPDETPKRARRVAALFRAAVLA